jgi:hypothetical protein
MDDGFLREMSEGYAFDGPSLLLGAPMLAGVIAAAAPVRLPLSMVNRHGHGEGRYHGEAGNEVEAGIRRGPGRRREGQIGVGVAKDMLPTADGRRTLRPGFGALVGKR